MHVIGADREWRRHGAPARHTSNRRAPRVKGNCSFGESSEARSPSHPRVEHALELFASIYGAEAGNVALKALAVGGVFVDGGIALKKSAMSCERRRRR
ncbi:MAG: glucokinase [Candidatus Rokubacteria bacterium]|nr:glucokinase [Candidatus Rokubacteria bacterium]